MNEDADDAATRRCRQLAQWAASQLSHPVVLEPASSDASFRRYFRLQTDDGTRILMDAPPEHEPLAPWLSCRSQLAAAGLRVPQVDAVDLELGTVLMEDFGSEVLLDQIDACRVDSLYQSAMTSLLRIQTGASTAGLKPYSAELLRRELRLYSEWLLGRHLGLTLDAAEVAEWQALEAGLIGSALSQPRVFVHRDFHSRNLTPPLVTGGAPGILDFQDAVLGPISYDLVSLLRDCYVAWPEAQVEGWLDAYHEQLLQAGLPGAPTPALWRRWCDWMGVQRHLKAAGIFCRLCHRDGKPGYLNDVPRIHDYLLAVARRYPELEALERLVRTRVIPAWSAGGATATD